MHRQPLTLKHPKVGELAYSDSEGSTLERRSSGLSVLERRCTLAARDNRSVTSDLHAELCDSG